MIGLYTNLLRRYPFVVQSVQTGIFMGAGDLTAQCIVDRTSLSDVNLSRTGRFFLLGTFMVGPSVTIWYRILDKYIGSKGKKVAIQKMIVDQTIFAPAFLSAFLMVLSGMKGRSYNEAVSDLKENYVDVLITNYKLWPAAQLINFYIMPLNYQVMFVQSVALIWNTYISWKTNLVRKSDE